MQREIVRSESWSGKLGRTLKGWFGVQTSPTFITDTLLLGNREDAQSSTKLMLAGVSHVLNSATQLPNYHPDHFLYCNLALLDSESADIRPHLNKAFDFIDDAVAHGTRVLVHCIAGANGSAV